jgi:signal transduction histidine kinase/DNA-binding response OmpR family regulator
MINTILFRLSKIVTRYGLLFIFLFSFKTYTFCDVSTINNDSDSLKNIVDTCTSDTCRFKILINFFWTYAEKDLNRVKHIGEWAYNEIKNSNNLRALSDGYDVMGFILEKEKKYDSAYVLFIKALVISKKIGYNPRTGWSYYHLGIINDALGHTDSALIYLKILYRFDVEKSYMPSACEVLNEIAYIYERIEQPDSALHYHFMMLELSQQIQDKGKEMDAYVGIINFYNKTNNTKKMLGYINEALKLAENTNNEKALTYIYYLIGDLFLKQKKNYEIAMIYYKKVLEICKEKNKYSEASVLNDIGNLYLEEGNDSLALIYVLQGLKKSREIKFKHQISESYKNLGTIYKYQGKFLEAINNFKICYDTGCDKCPKIAFHNSLIDIADSYLQLNYRRKALEYYNESLNLAEEFKSNNELAISNLKIGNYYRLVNENLSLKYYQTAIQYARKAKDITVLKTIADTLSSFLENNHDYKAAFEYQILARTMEDSINKIERQASMAEWELKFEFEKITKENEAKEHLSKEEIKRQKVYRNGALLISSLLIILGFFVFNSYRRKKKVNRLLVEQKKQIEDKNQEILLQVEKITSQKNEIERISNELHESDEMKFRFFANVSHEFRTPLTLIINPAQKLLEASSHNSEFRKQLEYIYINALKMYELTNQIMDLQKLESGKLKLNPEKGNIVTYCLGIASSFESLCYKKNNAILFRSNYRSVNTFFDKDKTGKILGNLLSNALKFCYMNTVIEVSIVITENNFNLSVHDFGIGISGEQIDEVFKRYYQASNSDRKEGTGIGLAYVKELVGCMNGKVGMESIINKGTKVNIAIPLIEFEITDSSEFIVEIPKTGITSQGKEFETSYYKKENQNTVLIVEDNDELRVFITDLLENEYNMCTANNGESGTQAAFEYIPDIIISDVMMPGMDGFEMCATLKKDIRTSHIPIILLTAKDSSQSSIEGYQTGADDYIIKPFNNELLRLKVKNILATRESIRKQFNSDLNTLPNSGAFSDIDKSFIKKCIQIIEQNINNPDFSVEKLSFELAFSRSNLYRKLQSLTDFNPAELIRNIRMQHAVRLLKTSNIRVYEVAMEVGYDNTNKFSQAFKKQYGVLPSEMQKKFLKVHGAISIAEFGVHITENQGGLISGTSG